MNASVAVADQTECVVCVRNAWARYKVGNVLQGLHMNVDASSIYALLGASGCGKTTLICSILGLKKLDSGTIRVWGKEPSGLHSEYASPTVSYMPQTLSLYPNFTIEETFHMFGNIHRMSRAKINKQFEFYSELLKLPKFKTRCIGCLSGGQKVRVSLAVSLINDAKLIILDEPTVGVDPMLRETIWRHLVELSSAGKTIIISTHYLEEVKRADKVGFMRNGRILTEDSPKELQRQYGTSSLEKIFLLVAKGDVTNTPAASLCKIQEAHKKEEITKPSLILARNNYVYHCHIIKGIIWKEYVRVVRNVLLVILLGGIPVFGVCAAALVMTNASQFASLGVVNYEKHNDILCNSFKYSSRYENCSHPTHESCVFMQYIDSSSPTQYLEPFESVEEAQTAITDGRLRAAIVFPAHFSANIRERILFGRRASDGALERSDIRVIFDTVYPATAYRFMHTMTENLNSFLQELIEACKLNARIATLPLKYEPVLGDEDTITDVIARSVMGIIVVSHFISGMYVATTAFLEERHLFMLDRLQTAGVTQVHLYIGYLFIPFALSIVQISLGFSIAVFVFGVPFHINPVFPVALLLLQTSVAVSLGFLIASIVRDEISATMIAVFVLLAVQVTSGAVTPTEFLPPITRHIIYVLPCTRVISSLLLMTTAGLDPCHRLVWPGFLAPVIWTGVLLIIIIIVKICKKHL